MSSHPTLAVRRASGPWTQPRGIRRLVTISTIIAVAIGALFARQDDSGTIYYVDVQNGSDLGQGSRESPWKSFDKARREATAHDTVYVTGNGDVTFSENVPPRRTTDFTIFRADPRGSPRLAGISIDYAEHADAFLEFDGFQVVGSARMTVVGIHGAAHVIITNSDISSTWPAYGSAGVIGVDISDSDHIRLQHCRVHMTHVSVQTSKSSAVEIIENHLIPIDGTAVKWLGGNIGGAIQENHINGENLVGYPGGPGWVSDPHSSMISLRSDGVEITGNLMHDMGSSSGIMFYEPDAAGGLESYSNISIVNNAIYNTINVFAIRIYNLGNNVRIINNLVFSRYRRDGNICPDGITPDARYRYSTALQVHSVGNGFDGSGLHVFNNIFIGRISVPDGIDESHNIVWSWEGGGSLAGGWRAGDESPSHTSVIVTGNYLGCGHHPTLFEGGEFFRGAFGPTAEQITDPKALYFSKGSLGVNFGDPERQPDSTLGFLSTAGFIQMSGIHRDANVHSVGPFEPTMPLPPRGLRILPVL